MSNLIFPLTFQGNIGFPLKQTPQFNTIVQSPASGRGEIRIPTMQFPRWKFELDVSFLSGDAQGTYKGSQIVGGTQWQQLVNFYMAVQGQAAPWLFFHPYDNSVGSYTVVGTLGTKTLQVGEPLKQAGTNTTANFIAINAANTLITISGYAGVPDNTHAWVGQVTGAAFTASALPVGVSFMPFATGDGSTTAFSIIRTFVTAGAQDLIQNFVGSPTNPLIYDNGSLVSAANYSIDQYGTITFTVAPLNTHTLSWAGQFYYLCRFEADEWGDLQSDFYQLWSMNGLKFISVLL